MPCTANLTRKRLVTWRSWMALALMLWPCVPELQADQREQAEQWHVTVSSGDHDREAGCWVSAALPQQLAECSDLQLTVPTGSGVIPCQVNSRGKRARLFFRLPTPLKAKTSLQLILARPPKKQLPTAEDGVQMALRKGQIHVKVHDKPLLAYHCQSTTPPKDIDPLYSRSGYIHPVTSPAGQQVTGDYAADHAHQHALFHAFVSVMQGQNRYDLWNEHKRLGKISHQQVLSAPVSGPLLGHFQVSHRHVGLRNKSEQVPLWNETWNLVAYANTDVFMFDVTSGMQSISPDPITITKYKYGGMALRGNSQWLTNDSLESRGAVSGFLTSEGIGRIAGNHTTCRWVSMHGKVNGKPCGVAVLSHPDNFRFPQYVRLHPTKPYFCFATMKDSEFVFTKTTRYSNTYRYLVFDGKPNPDFIERRWRDFAHPPKCVVISHESPFPSKNS